MNVQNFDGEALDDVVESKLESFERSRDFLRG